MNQIAWRTVHAAQDGRWGRGWGDRKGLEFSWYIDNEPAYPRRVVRPSPNRGQRVRDAFEGRDFFCKLARWSAVCLRPCSGDRTRTGIPLRPDGLGNAMMSVSVIPSGVVSGSRVSGCPRRGGASVYEPGYTTFHLATPRPRLDRPDGLSSFWPSSLQSVGAGSMRSPCKAVPLPSIVSSSLRSTQSEIP